MSTHGFSLTFRDQLIDRLRSERFDLLIVGGGITGAGIALDAVSRGLKVALIEQKDFAFGTSSRSTKLIHGGLRYLKQFEFGLVKEVGSERAVVHKLAPHLVIPEKMLLPLFVGKSFGYWITSIGLKIYDWLADVKKEDQRRMLTRPQTLRLEPLLKKESIKGGAIYAEYRTDDARLTLEIMKTAFQHGAITLNYVAGEDFLYNNAKVCGVSAVDRLTKEPLEIRAAVVVNAAGPWVDELRVLDKSRTGRRLHLTKGIHIVVPREKLPIKQAIYFDVDDGRMIFAIPRGRITYIGTTDTNYAGDKDHVVATSEDANYLIRAVNNMFPEAKLVAGDIQSSWAGLRPLIHEEGKSASELSRKDEIFESRSGLISIAGGKLTGYRKMAERVVDFVIDKHFDEHPFKKCFTHSIKLVGNAFDEYRNVQDYHLNVVHQLEPFGLDGETARYLVENYGQQTEEIVKRLGEQSHHEDPELSLLLAELWFCFQHEMVVTLPDFFSRRTGMLNFNINSVIKRKGPVAEALAVFSGWSQSRKLDELHLLDEMISDAKIHH